MRIAPGAAPAADRLLDPKATSLNSVLRDRIASRIELLIEILDRLDGDPDFEVDAVEDENIDECWLQPVSLGPAMRTVRRHHRRGLSDGRQMRLLGAEGSDTYGSRESVRGIIGKQGSTAPNDVELFSALLSLVMPRRDTVMLAERLMSQFGGFSAALAAPAQQLAKVDGMGAASAGNLKLILAAAQRFAHDQVDYRRPILSSWTQLIDYCHATMSFEGIEHLRLLFLDKKNRVIADEVQQTGTVDHTPVYPREVIKRSLEVNATALILVHNHPSGDPSPSTADVQMTKQIVHVAKSLGIIVHDHIIIGRGGYASMRALRLI